METRVGHVGSREVPLGPTKDQTLTEGYTCGGEVKAGAQRCPLVSQHGTWYIIHL